MTATFDRRATKKMLYDYSRAEFVYDGTPIKEMIVKEVSCDFARDYIATFHYSKTMPDSSKYIYAGYLNGKLCGIIVYGMGCGKNQYTALIPDIKNGTYVELTRLWCVNSMPKNTESKLISESLKMLPKEIKLIISFADEAQGHCGIIYQATNWYYLGQNGGGKMLLTESGVKKHTRLLGIYRMRHPEYKEYTNEELMEKLGYTYTESGRKHRYVYLRGTKREKKEMYELIKDKIQPYPKIDKKPSISEMEILEEESKAAPSEAKQISLFDMEEEKP